MRRHPLLALLALLVASSAGAQETVHAFRGATILPISGPAIPDGVLVVRGGRIQAVGPAASTAVPAGATVHDLAGKVVMPGLVDSHSHIGGGSGGDASSSLHPSVRILDAINARDASIQKARAGGVTTVNVMPGSGHLVSGQTAYLKLREGNTIYDLLLCGDVLREVCGGLKMANGTNPLDAPPFSGTRAKSAAMVRDLFVRAQGYRDKIRAARGDSTKLPARDLELEPLVEVLEGRRVVHNHTHRHDDILTAIRLAQEFGYRMVLQHASEAALVAEEIAAAGYPASIILIDAPGGKLETLGLVPENAAALEKAGAIVGLHTDDGVVDSRFFLRSAGLAVRAGMTREGALRALTVNNARMLGVEERVGTLEPGKDADFLVLSGDPLSVYTHVEETWVEGRRVFDRDDPEDRKHAVGGYGVFGDTNLHHFHAEGAR